MFKYFKLMYEPSVLSLFRKCLSHTRKLIGINQQIVFLSKCKAAEVLPKSFIIKSPVSSSKGKRIANRTGFRFLAAAVDLCFGRRRHLQYLLHYYTICFVNSIQLCDRLCAIQFLHNYSSCYSAKTSYILSRKFDRLLSMKSNSSGRAQPSFNKNWLLNFSSYTPSPDEVRVLERSFNFAYGSRPHLPTLLAAVETAITDLNIRRKHQIRTDEIL